MKRNYFATKERDEEEINRRKKELRFEERQEEMVREVRKARSCLSQNVKTRPKLSPQKLSRECSG